MTNTLNKRGPGRPRNLELTSQRQEEILATATEVFADRGYASTDVQEIADRLGIAKGTVYHYFPSKEQLFLASVDRGMAGLSRAINEGFDPKTDPIKQIAQAIRAFLQYFDTNADVIELIVQERAEFRDRKKPTYLEHRERNVRPWNELFEALSLNGRFKPINAEQVTQTISNLLYGTIFTTYFARHGQSFESLSNQVLKLVFAGILSESEMANIDKYLEV
ncbi:TetR/AcrR family transcriptional regulator [Candidatus Obscuribacterales bacterium]|nr:TetR/AcrR family transcriptional regulator [Candidatus Obscuribacterales bacterium]MBX3135184.1 TetR/AcrR family transcriptional regulator [Candidatus Obscuribacterales bacterium]MBX3148706.1 TetR/AcrR family transcriptional regulator [Candidatus Obscuribacterales bacterium]